MSESDALARVGRKMVTGAGWTVGSRMVVRMLGLVSTVILARLLEPSDFGLIALATGIATAIWICGTLDFRVWLVRLPDPQRSHYDTLWSMSVIRGAVIGLLILAASSAIADAFDEPRLEVVLVVLAARAMLEGLRNPGVVDFERDLAFDRDFLLFTLPKVGAFVVTVGLGIWLRSYWALVAGIVARTAIDLALSYTMHAFRPRPSLRHWHEAFDFTKWLLAGNVLGFGYLRSDTIVLGALSGTQVVGIYAVAREIVEVGSTRLVAPIRRVMLPGFSRLSGDPEHVRIAFFNGFSLIVMIGLPCAIGMALLADPLIRLLLGEKWVESIVLVQILSVYGLTSIVMANQGPLFLALGHTRVTANLLALGLFLLLPSFVWATSRYGPAGGAAAVSAANIVVLLMSLRFSLQLLSASVGDVVAAIWRSVAATALMSIAVEATLGLVAGWWTFAVVVIGVLTGAASYAAALYLLWRWCGAPAGGESILLDFVAEIRRGRLEARSAPT